jgi:hypothetical protein
MIWNDPLPLNVDNKVYQLQVASEKGEAGWTFTISNALEEESEQLLSETLCIHFDPDGVITDVLPRSTFNAVISRVIQSKLESSEVDWITGT